MSRRTPARAAALLTLTALAGLVAACGEESDSVATDPQEVAYTATLAVPPASAYSDASEEDPQADDAIVRLTLTSGSEVAIWVDPTDKRRVYQQHSSPTDPAAWTKPALLYTAGDGCLLLEGATDGTTVAATLGCYENDTFIQQAPDQGQAVVSTDLADWQLHDAGELWTTPVFKGDRITWEDSGSWSPENGFEFESD